MILLKSIDYSTFTQVDGSLKRTVYRKKSFVEKFIKKFYIKEICLGLVAGFSLYGFMILGFACSQC